MGVAALLATAGLGLIAAGMTAEPVAAHLAFCLGAGPAPAGGTVSLLGHCAACWAGLAALFGAGASALAGR